MALLEDGILTEEIIVSGYLQKPSLVELAHSLSMSYATHQSQVILQPPHHTTM